DKVKQSHVLDIDKNNRQATIIADISQKQNFPAEQFDCIIFTQTLQFIADPQAAIDSLHHMLKPGGRLLLTCPGITRVQTVGPEKNWYWSFTPVSLERLLMKRFRPETVDIHAHGNVFAATCFLWGVAMEEVDQKELNYVDPNYPLIVSASAKK
ncbi:MAG: class I SAM-dependent methyltransferase, partial [Xanthomonadales bacterium]|nr:class I SAM-dependent methyltransferase [Xanthomonadales bacterium]